VRKINRKKNLVLGLTLLIAGIATLTAVGVARADTTNTAASWVANLATKLNLPQSQVQTAVDQIRSEQEQARQEQQSTRLDQAVTDGVITQEQKDKLVAKMQEEQATRQKNRSEMQTWMSDNGIDASKLREYMGGPHSGQGSRGFGPRPELND